VLYSLVKKFVNICYDILVAVLLLWLFLIASAHEEAMIRLEKQMEILTRTLSPYPPVTLPRQDRRNML
jgi:hypothetical protein